MDNNNPTIHLVSDLPTRRRSSAAEHEDPRGLLAAAMPPETIWDPLDDAHMSSASSDDDSVVEPIDEQEIYDLIATMSDPEHPLSLGSLAVVNLPDIRIGPLSARRPDSRLRRVEVLLTPTVDHCSLATVIGLGVRVRLEQALPPRFRIDVRIKEGTHASADEANKQLGDKERVAAALENSALWDMIRKMIETCV